MNQRFSYNLEGKCGLWIRDQTVHSDLDLHCPQNLLASTGKNALSLVPTDSSAFRRISDRLHEMIS